MTSQQQRHVLSEPSILSISMFWLCGSHRTSPISYTPTNSQTPMRYKTRHKRPVQGPSISKHRQNEHLKTSRTVPVKWQRQPQMTRDCAASPAACSAEKWRPTDHEPAEHPCGLSVTHRSHYVNFNNFQGLLINEKVDTTLVVAATVPTCVLNNICYQQSTVHLLNLHCV